MAGATVIDQLIVKLGLDPRDFTKGQKQAAEGMLRTEKQVKKSSDSMGRSVAGFTGKLLGIASAVVALKKVIEFTSELSVSLNQLGLDARAAGMAANEMRNFQNISEMFGGKPEDATKAIQNITKAVYDLAYNGQINDSLIMLGRLGVQFQDTAGNARGFKDIVLDTEAAIQKSLKRGTSYENANQMLLQAGFDPGMARAMLEGNVSGELAKQNKRRQADAGTVGSAINWEKSAKDRSQSIDAASMRGFEAVAKAGAVVNEEAARGFDYAGTASMDQVAADASKLVSKAATVVGEVLDDGGKKIYKGVQSLVKSLDEAGNAAVRRSHPKGRKAYEKTIQAAAAKQGIPAEILAGVLATESNFDPAAVSEAGAVGVAQLMPQYFKGAGENPHADIHTAAAELRRLLDHYDKKGYKGTDLFTMALRGYNAGQSRLNKSMQPGGKPLDKETVEYPGKVFKYARSATPTPNAQGGGGVGGNHTEVHIGKVDVNTRATDADGIAEDFAGATRRKFNTSQAEKGMQ